MGAHCFTFRPSVRREPAGAGGRLRRWSSIRRILAHVAVARAARDQLALDRLLVVPAGTPPHHERHDVGRDAAMDGRAGVRRRAERSRSARIEMDRGRHQPHASRRSNSWRRSVDLFLIMGADQAGLVRLLARDGRRSGSWPRWWWLPARGSAPLRQRTPWSWRWRRSTFLDGRGEQPQEAGTRRGADAVCGAGSCHAPQGLYGGTPC